MLYIILVSLCLTVAYMKIKKWEKKKKDCSEKICVQVVEIVSKKAPKGSGLVYKPIFRICSIKKEIIIDSAFYSSLLKFQIGQVIWIYANPNNIQEFIYDSPYYNPIVFLDIFGCFIPLIMMVIYILFS